MAETFVNDNLFAGNVMPVVTGELTIEAGQNLARGSVLGVITASGKAKLVDKESVDGSQVVYAVLAEATDATAADKVAPVYLTGEFNSAKLTVGAGDTVADHVINARKVGLFFKSVVKA